MSSHGASQRRGNTVVKGTGGAGMSDLEGNIRQGGGVVGAKVVVHRNNEFSMSSQYAFWIARSKM